MQPESHPVPMLPAAQSSLKKYLYKLVIQHAKLCFSKKESGRIPVASPFSFSLIPLCNLDAIFTPCFPFCACSQFSHSPFPGGWGPSSGWLFWIATACCAFQGTDLTQESELGTNFNSYFNSLWVQPLRMEGESTSYVQLSLISGHGSAMSTQRLAVGLDGVSCQSSADVKAVSTPKYGAERYVFPSL